MLEHRSGCPINLSLEVFGDKWSLIVIRDMMFGNRRHFNEFLAKSDEGIASNVLADRLQRLVALGMISRAPDASHKQKVIYSLTEPAIQLVPVLAHLGAWGRRHLPVTRELCGSRRAARGRGSAPSGTTSWTSCASSISASCDPSALRRCSVAFRPPTRQNSRAPRRPRPARRRRGSCSCSPARPGSAAGSARNPGRRCRARPACRSSRAGRSPSGAAGGRGAGPPPGASRTTPTTWMATVASGRSTEKFATLLTTSTLVRPSRNSSYSRSRSSTGVAPVSFGASSASASSSIWSRYWPMTRMRSPSCLATSSRTTRSFGGRGGREPVALVVGARRVLEPLLGRQVDAHLVAGCGGDEALRLDLFPRGVEALRADEREHVGLASVLAHERGGEAEAASRLQLGGQLEDRGGQQVHLVVDDEAPVESVEQREVGVLALPLRGEDLVRRDRDRLDLLDGARVLADLVLGERRALQQLAAPLAGADGVGHQDQRRGVGLRHRTRHRRGSCRRRRGAPPRPTRPRRSWRPPSAGSRAGASRPGSGRSRAGCRGCSRRGPLPASRASAAPA